MQFQIGRFFRTHRGETSAGSSSGSGPGTRPGSRSSAASDAGRLSALRSRNTGLGSPRAMPPRQAAPSGADAHRQEDIKAAIAHMRGRDEPQHVVRSRNTGSGNPSAMPPRQAAPSDADAHRQEDIQAAIAHMHGRDEPQHVGSPRQQAVPGHAPAAGTQMQPSGVVPDTTTEPRTPPAPDVVPTSSPQESHGMEDDFDIDSMDDDNIEAIIDSLRVPGGESTPISGETSAAITSRRSDTFALGRNAPQGGDSFARDREALPPFQPTLTTIPEEPAEGASPMHPSIRDAFQAGDAENAKDRREDQRDVLLGAGLSNQEIAIARHLASGREHPAIEESGASINAYRKDRLPPLREPAFHARRPQQTDAAETRPQGNPAQETSQPAPYQHYVMRQRLSEENPEEVARMAGLDQLRISDGEPDPVHDLASVREHPANGETDASMLKYDRQGLPPLRDAPLSAAQPRQLGAEASAQPGGAETTLPAPSGQPAPAASSSNDDFQEARDFLSIPSATSEGSAQQETTPRLAPRGAPTRPRRCRASNPCCTGGSPSRTMKRPQPQLRPWPRPRPTTWPGSATRRGSGPPSRSRLSRPRVTRMPNAPGERATCRGSWTR
ncbi:hypothetical protein [Paracidovorax anthurii]|uniref:Uncharacterized protein n=1 Tax=Paracidovorax anthurii TaxID=78229 RepID=A0A328ZA99_9BURK|nr:hypothetical protein [Paracidovorax anthurii]RAR79697.1 hypothetical protein AX018_102519 [Paracidovorax anthurii]